MTWAGNGGRQVNPRFLQQQLQLSQTPGGLPLQHATRVAQPLNPKHFAAQHDSDSRPCQPGNAAYCGVESPRSPQRWRPEERHCRALSHPEDDHVPAQGAPQLRRMAAVGENFQLATAPPQFQPWDCAATQFAMEPGMDYSRFEAEARGACLHDFDPHGTNLRGRHQLAEPVRTRQPSFELKTSHLQPIALERVRSQQPRGGFCMEPPAEQFARDLPAARFGEPLRLNVGRQTAISSCQWPTASGDHEEGCQQVAIESESWQPPRNVPPQREVPDLAGTLWCSDGSGQAWVGSGSHGQGELLFEPPRWKLADLHCAGWAGPGFPKWQTTALQNQRHFESWEQEGIHSRVPPRTEVAEGWSGSTENLLGQPRCWQEDCQSRRDYIEQRTSTVPPPGSQALVSYLKVWTIKWMGRFPSNRGP